MGNRKGKQEIITSIIDCLSSGHKSIYEIAIETKINWESVKEYLEILKDIKIVDEKPDGKKRIFSLRIQMVNLNPNTLFGIPLNKEDDNVINYLFTKIREVWMKKTDKEIGKTQMHKTIVEIDEKCDLKLPTVLLYYGRMCLKAYSPEEQYTFNEIPNRNELDTCAENVVEELSKFQSTKNLESYQYKKEKNELYITKQKIYDTILYEDFNINTKNNIIGLFMKLISLLEKKDKVSEEIYDFVIEYVGTVIQVLNSNKESFFSSEKEEIWNSFNEIWKLIAIYKFYESLMNNQKYKQIEIFDYLRCEYDNRLMFVEDHIQRLNELIQKEEYDTDDYNKIRNLQGSVKGEPVKITNEEKNKMIEEMLNENKSR